MKSSRHTTDESMLFVKPGMLRGFIKDKRSEDSSGKGRDAGMISQDEHARMEKKISCLLKAVMKYHPCTRKSTYRVQEHGAVSSGENEAITVDPLGILGVVLKEVGPEDSADLAR
jgi:hypothetical protein